MSGALQPVSLACPRCGLALRVEVQGAWAARRCQGCGGLWLDPAALRAACEARPELDDAAPARGGGPERLYLRCPDCGEPMDRVNFAHVSGVVLDVCRRHGAWLDGGELRAVRRFLRGDGAARLFSWRRRRDARAEVATGALAPGGAGGDIDLLDELAGIPGPWDVAPRRSRPRWWARAAVLGAAGVGVLGLSLRAGLGGPWDLGLPVGLVLVLAAWRAAGRARRA